MKVRMIVNSDGTISGILPPETSFEVDSTEAPSHADVVCGKGSVVQEIDVPGKMVKSPIDELLQSYRIKNGSLVKKKPKSK